jgi:hypothetical protein
MNVVADSLSRYFKNDLPEEVHPDWEYVDIDIRLDPDGDNLPVDRYVEMNAAKEIKVSAARRSQRLRDKSEPRVQEAEQLASSEPEQPAQMNEDDVLVFDSGADRMNYVSISKETIPS